MPSVTSATAALRTAGVIRLKVPIWSSLPHRPQLEMFFIICTTSARVGFGGPGGAPWGCADIDRGADTATISVAASAVPNQSELFMGDLLCPNRYKSRRIIGSGVTA